MTESGQCPGFYKIYFGNCTEIKPFIVKVPTACRNVLILNIEYYGKVFISDKGRPENDKAV
jgi:hypothetical protein